MQALIYTGAIVIVCCSLSAHAQYSANPNDTEYHARAYEWNDALHPCITTSEFKRIEEQCNRNRSALGLAPIKKGPLTLTPLLWPLRPSTALNDCSYYFVAAYVDHNATTGTFTDYNCGSNTYDGHTGTDIAIGPFPFYKMDNSQVEVIAAAAGIIINKHDGEYDRNCVGSGSGLTANYIIVQHADGSVALYWHMKANSLTSKAVGQTVAAGEYLGIVGSSGSSSGPHLHFEVWSGSTASTLIDPYAGPCNFKNTASWWIAQKTYSEPAVVKASVHTTDIVTPACPATETPNESTTYNIPFQGPGLPAGYAKFYSFIRNAVAGQPVGMSILNPNSTVFNSWSYTLSTTSKFSIIGFTKMLPVTAGTYIFQAMYNSITCAQDFYVSTTLPVSLAWFKGEPKQGNNQLLWQTLSESGSEYFGVEKSDDGISFKEINRIKGAGSSNSIRNYSCTDAKEVEGLKYYRLKQASADGSHAYSDVIRLLNRIKTATVKMYPNPSHGKVSIRLDDRLNLASEIELTIINAVGQQVVRTRLVNTSTTLSATFQSDVFFYTVTLNGATISSGKLVVQ